ncbi:MAG: M1 family metallopeptidase, partial [Acidobacteriota bacterium]
SQLRVNEKEAMESFLKTNRITQISVFQASNTILSNDEAEIYLRVLFDSQVRVFLETWHLTFSHETSGWEIKEKIITSDLGALYRLSIPSDNIEHVHKLEFEHTDIQFSFNDAVCFYDNLPEANTAMVIIGEGRLYFSPSHPGEAHQLELFYGRSFLEDKLDYVYIRASNTFFKNRMKKIVKKSEPDSVRTALLDKAELLFKKHYSRSFTVQNSLTDELLSFLPQGDEAVFEFEGKKLGVMTYIYSPFSEEEINLYSWEEEKIINLYSPPSKEGEKRFFISFGQKFDLTHIDLELMFDPGQFFISGKASVKVMPQVSSLSSLKLKFNPDLRIMNILDEDGKQLFYTQDKLRKSLYIYFLNPPQKGEKAVVEVYYRGKVVPPVSMSDVVTAYQLDEKFLYVPSRYDTYLYSHFSYWYPNPSDDDYFTSTLRLSVPEDYQVFSNGKMIDEKVDVNNVVKEDENFERKRIFTFKTEIPIKYISFIAGKFNLIDTIDGSVPLSYYRDSEVRFTKKQTIEDAEKILHFFEKRFGSYPYQKLDIIRRLWSTVGGHSPASFIVLNELVPSLQKSQRLQYLYSPVDFSQWNEYFLAHEIAHQWWGQGVSWKTYHDQWLSEGLAQFSALIYLIDRNDDRTFRSILKKLVRTAEKYTDQGAITLGARLSYSDFESYQSIVYNKTTLVLLMLKDILGEDLFYQGLNEFFQKYKFQAARSSDFFRTFNQISDRDLNVFFKNWFDTHYLPKAHVSSKVEKKENVFSLKVKVIQPEKLFVFPLWLEWREEDRVVKRMVVVEKPVQEFEFQAPVKPKKIKIDPDGLLPGRVG